MKLGKARYAHGVLLITIHEWKITNNGDGVTNFIGKFVYTDKAGKSRTIEVLRHDTEIRWLFTVSHEPLFTWLEDNSRLEPFVVHGMLRMTFQKGK